METLPESTEHATQSAEPIPLPFNIEQLSIRDLEVEIQRIAISEREVTLKDFLSKCNRKARAEILQKDGYVESLLSNILKRGHDEKVVLLEKEYEVDVKKFLVTDNNECTIFCDAIGTRNMHSVNYLLEKGADVNQYCQEHQTPLVFACDMGSTDLVKKLVQHKADLDGKDGSKETPLGAAIRSESLGIVRYLLEKGADPNRHGLREETPLHTAVGCPPGLDKYFTKLLLQHNAVQTRNNEGVTPLFSAVHRRKEDMFEELFESSEDKVMALEMHAVTWVTHDMAKVFKSLWRAMMERDHREANVNPIVRTDDVPALGYALESRTQTELLARKFNNGALVMECLAIGKRNDFIWIDKKRIIKYLFDEGRHKELSYLLTHGNMVLEYDWKLSRIVYELLLEKGDVDCLHCVKYLDACISHIPHLHLGQTGFMEFHSVSQQTVDYLALCIARLTKEQKDIDLLNRKTSELFDPPLVAQNGVFRPLNWAVRLWSLALKHHNHEKIVFYVNLIEHLLSLCAPVNSLDEYQVSPLHIVVDIDNEVKKDSSGIVSHPPITVDGKDRTDSLAVARQLLAHCADPYRLDENHRTPAQCASDEMKRLLKNFCRPLKCIAALTIARNNLSLDGLPVLLKRFVVMVRSN